MQKFGGVAIPMQQSLDKEELKKIIYLIGTADGIYAMQKLPVKEPFDKKIEGFLNEVSKILTTDNRAKIYSDVMTFAFWIRKANIEQLKRQFERKDNHIRLGKGLAFHIAPSNVPVNFAFSLVVGLLTGNSNIVRVPSKEFGQVKIVVEAMQRALLKPEYQEINSYIALIRYERDRKINNVLSKMADIRVIWGGDSTIEELRYSAIPARCTEITFADRYSLAVIDSDVYLEIKEKGRVAESFYNDTYFSDQNACTSPKVIIWTGKRKEEAKQGGGETLHSLVERKYDFQPIKAIDKWTSACLAAVGLPNCELEKYVDNLIIRVKISEITEQLMEYKDHSGYFLEYNCDNIFDIRPLCDNKGCQTVGIIGNKEQIYSLIQSGIKGIDRVVPIGKTMDFDMVWDGYDLVSQMTRIVKIE